MKEQSDSSHPQATPATQSPSAETPRPRPLRRGRAGNIIKTTATTAPEFVENVPDTPSPSEQPPPGGQKPQPAGTGDSAALIPEVCEKIGVWWVNGGGSTFQVRNGEHWLEIPREALVTKLLLHGISAGKNGGPVEQHRECLLHIMENRHVDRAIEALAGWGCGIHHFKGFSCLVRKGPTLIEPRTGDWPLIGELLMGLLGLDHVSGAAGMVQYERFLYWLARAARNVHRPVQSNLNSQILILAGPAGSGKSLIQHLIITPVLGGRSGNPSKYVFGRTEFNEGWLGCEHLLIEDPEPHPRTQDRLMLAQILKGLCVNQSHTLHPKGKSELGVPARFVVTLSINDDPDAIRILPKMTPDFTDKVQLFHIRHIPPDLLPQEDGEKDRFAAAISAEIPAFLDYLLSLVVPEKLREKRFGVQSYLNPELLQRMGDDTPEGEFLQLLDHGLIRGKDSGVDKLLWHTPQGCSAEEYLRNNPQTRLRPLLETCIRERKRVWAGSAIQLTDTMEGSVHSRVWRKLADHISIPRLLGRLAADRPDRIQPFEGNRIRHGWLIVAPGPEEEPDGALDPF